MVPATTLRCQYGGFKSYRDLFGRLSGGRRVIHLEQDGGLSNHANKNRDYRERDELDNLVRRLPIARSSRPAVHALGDNRSKLQHMFAQFSILLNVALNAIAVCLYFLI